MSCHVGHGGQDLDAIGQAWNRLDQRHGLDPEWPSAYANWLGYLPDPWLDYYRDPYWRDPWAGDPWSSGYGPVIVVSDGRPTVCPFVRGQGRSEQLIREILQQTTAANPGLEIRVHTIYVGTDNDPQAIDFMRRLARTHKGTFRIVNH